MAITLAVASTGTTTANITASNIGASGTVEVQYSIDPDFAFSVSPVATGLARTSPIAMTGLNQDATYFVRARTRLSSGVAEDWSNVVGLRTGLAAAPSLTPTSVMITPAMVVVPNRVLQWVGVNGIAGYPADNLALDAPVAYKSFIASGLHAIEAVMAPDPVDTVALLMTNLPENATVTLKAGPDQANVRGGSPAYNSGALPFRASANLPGRPGFHGLFRLAQQVKQPYWRIEINAPDLTGDILHVEHCIFGWNRSTKNHSVDRTEQPNDTGKLERLRSGVPDRTRGLRGRSAAFEISVNKVADDWKNYADLSYKVGETDPVLVVPNSRAGVYLHDEILYGAVQVKKTQPASLLASRSFQIESILP